MIIMKDHLKAIIFLVKVIKFLLTLIKIFKLYHLKILIQIFLIYF